MAVVIGALLLVGLYALFGDTVMPTLIRRIQEMFNYEGKHMVMCDVSQPPPTFPANLQLVQAILFLSLLLAVTFYDLKQRIIPDKLNAAIALTAL